MMKVFVYRVDHDRGLAPNPFLGLCSLAVCKPRIRAKARVGDLVLGTSSYDRNKVRRSGVAGGRAVYVMRVTDVSNFGDYHRDHPEKRPSMKGSRLRCAGDAIYHRDPATHAWVQADSLHSGPGGAPSLLDLKRDVGITENILVSRDFAYWGRDAPELPADLAMFTRKEMREKHDFSDPEKTALLAWAKPWLGGGLLGEPIDWME